MNTTITRRLLAGALGAGLALLGAAAPAAAAPGDSSVSVGRLVLDPTDRGYAGSLPVTVTYRGAQAGYLDLAITEPVPGAFVATTPSDPCFFSAPKPVRTIYCSVPGGALQPGERRRFSVDFRVLTTTRPYAMATPGGRVAVTTGDANPANDTADVTALFRSTTGSLDDPRPYVRDTRTHASVAAAGPVVLARQEDGTWSGRLPVTVRVDGDAAHDAYWLTPTLPAGVEVVGTEPAAMCGADCEVPGGQFMPGEERTVTLLLRASADVAPGDLGPGSVRLFAVFGWGDELADVDPTDNTATFYVTAAAG
ncbi:hypothetical protein [Micromonospora auratinigra]|uniref:Uncharacterized protein n=1 Tax=Micromonospora auratinigra TaxID=261654 RepID=A0A1A8ZVY1_9ACTN|nr:hypothetical protein [Micromonospora auratinigra]SBT47996.1 hypothetical protein GA0070611_3920 [Micromonospora auratinigra]